MSQRVELPSEEGHWNIPQSVTSPEECPCPHHIQQPNPHPSETQPSVRCGSYYPYYCNSMSRETPISCGSDEPGLMVHLNKQGGIQVAKGKQQRDFLWSRPPPLHQPISNSVTDFVRTEVWDPRFAQHSVGHQTKSRPNHS
jgi:hypothetical protein